MLQDPSSSSPRPLPELLDRFSVPVWRRNLLSYHSVLPRSSQTRFCLPVLFYLLGMLSVPFWYTSLHYLRWIYHKFSWFSSNLPHLLLEYLRQCQLRCLYRGEDWRSECPSFSQADWSIYTWFRLLCIYYRLPRIFSFHCRRRQDTGVPAYPYVPQNFRQTLTPHLSRSE